MEEEEFEHCLDRMKARHEESIKRVSVGKSDEFVKAKMEYRVKPRPVPFVLKYPDDPLKNRTQ